MTNDSRNDNDASQATTGDDKSRRPPPVLRFPRQGCKRYAGKTSLFPHTARFSYLPIEKL